LFFEATQPWHLFCPGACQRMAYAAAVVITDPDYDVPGIYHVAFQHQAPVAVVASCVQEAIGAVAKMTGVLYWPKFPHVVGPQRPPPAPPPAPAPPPRPKKIPAARPALDPEILRAKPTVAHLSVRARKAVRRALAGQNGNFDATPILVATLTADEILFQKNTGKATLAEVQAWLAAHGRELGTPPDPLTGNVYADWLEENGEPIAAAKLRAAFPLDDGART
jgi:hypothetical protein